MNHVSAPNGPNPVNTWVGNNTLSGDWMRLRPCSIPLHSNESPPPAPAPAPVPMAHNLLHGLRDLADHTYPAGSRSRDARINHFTYPEGRTQHPVPNANGPVNFVPLGLPKTPTVALRGGSGFGIRPKPI